MRQAILDGARLWQEKAHRLRSIVENLRTDPGLTGFWAELLLSYTTETTEMIRAEQRRGLAGAEVEVDDVAASLSWLGERLYYLASIDVAPSTTNHAGGNLDLDLDEHRLWPRRRCTGQFTALIGDGTKRTRPGTILAAAEAGSVLVGDGRGSDPEC